MLAADVAHIAGLIVGGAHPSPVGHADVISTTTHKTLRGPRGAMLMCAAEHAHAIDRAVFPGLQGGPHDHTTAAIAVALHEAAQPALRRLRPRDRREREALADALIERGFDLVSGGTDNHLLLVDLTNRGVGGRPAAEALERAGLVCNYNAVPFDPRPPMDPSGIRLGTPAITTRGLGAGHMATLARWIDEASAPARPTARSHPRRGPRARPRLPAAVQRVRNPTSAALNCSAWVVLKPCGASSIRASRLPVHELQPVRLPLASNGTSASASLCSVVQPAVRVLRRLVDERRHRTREDGGGDALGAVEGEVAGDLAAAHREADQRHVAQVERGQQRVQVGREGVEVVARPRL